MATIKPSARIAYTKRSSIVTAQSIMPPSAPRFTTTSFERERLVAVAVGTHDDGREQRSPFFEIPPGQHGVKRRLHPGERNVGQESQAALVDADQRHVERRQPARDREHRAVAAQHDRQVGARRPFGRRRGRVAGKRRVKRAVSASSTTAWPFADKERREAWPAAPPVPGLAWRPTSATRGKRAGRWVRTWASD